mmetsp:Transcript_19488/g.46514  ORF Transcript_19488/g.46514 Transcript_19488/m.46514 type:complete len:414 (-) Transcript_19488:1458-2699(-)
MRCFAPPGLAHAPLLRRTPARPAARARSAPGPGLGGAPRRRHRHPLRRRNAMRPDASQARAWRVPFTRGCLGRARPRRPAHRRRSRQRLPAAPRVGLGPPGARRRARRRHVGRGGGRGPCGRGHAPRGRRKRAWVCRQRGQGLLAAARPQAGRAACPDCSLLPRGQQSGGERIVPAGTHGPIHEEPDLLGAGQRSLSGFGRAAAKGTRVHPRQAWRLHRQRRLQRRRPVQHRPDRQTPKALERREPCRRRRERRVCVDRSATRAQDRPAQRPPRRPRGGRLPRLHGGDRAQDCPPKRREVRRAPRHQGAGQQAAAQAQAGAEGRAQVLCRELRVGRAGEGGWPLLGGDSRRCPPRRRHRRSREELPALPRRAAPPRGHCRGWGFAEGDVGAVQPEGAVRGLLRPRHGRRAAAL